MKIFFSGLFTPANKTIPHADIPGCRAPYQTGKGSNLLLALAIRLFNNLLCYWAVRELGQRLASMSRRLDLSITAVSQSALRGELPVKQNNLLLVEGGKFTC